jgi:dienelactone hydrolase
MRTPTVWDWARRFRRALFFPALAGAAVGLLASCQSAYLFFDPADKARDLAREKGWAETHIDAGAFILTGFRRPSSFSGANPSDELHIYLEGDGHAWESKSRISPDPTPLDPVALKMALSDPGKNVFYLARPCQYTTQKTRRNCDNARYWTSWRFSKEVIEATNRAIDTAKKNTKSNRIALIGYSGGGAVAALVAARRQDVFLLVTAAGTLDHAAWTTHHFVSPLRDSLNPIDFASSLASIRQIHLVGSEDEIMPAKIARSYLNALPQQANARLVNIPGYDHNCCWAENWPETLKKVVEKEAP